MIEEVERLKNIAFQQANEQRLKDKYLRKEQRRLKRIFMYQSILITFLLVQLTIIFLINK
jgi:hypothetical protein